MRNFYPEAYATFPTKQVKHAVVVAIVFFVTVLPVKLFAQAPTISYNGPQTYTAGTAITPLAPTSGGVAPPAYGTSPILLGPEFGNPSGIAADATGNVYLADGATGLVRKIPVGGGAPLTLATGFNQVTAVAVDPAGNVYVAEYAGLNPVYKIPVGGGAPIKIASGFSSPVELATDAADNVYVANRDTNGVVDGGEIYKIPVNGGSPFILASFATNVDGVAVDAAGNIFVNDGNGAVYKIPVGEGARVRIASGSGIGGAGLAIDGSGNLFMATFDAVQEIAAGSGTPVTCGSGLLGPLAVAVDGAGNLYTIPSDGSARTWEIKPVGGYHIGPFLPAGLSFNSATGVVSGTPTISSPATNYTITAYNSAGVSKKATLNIKVIGNAYLSALKIAGGNISPSFAKTTNSYSASVAQNKTTTTVTPTTADPNATVTVNGVAVVSGTASTAIPLAVGATDIIIMVTASDRVSTDNYHITVYRPASNNANLSNLHSSHGVLSPALSSAVNSYAVSVGNSVTSITLTPTTSDPTATVKVNGVTVKSGTASTSIPLVVGPNTITTVVTAQDGTTKKMYTLTVTRAPSSNANLSNLHPSHGVLSPAISLSITSYTVSVGNSVTSITVTPTTSDAAATAKVNGTAVISGTASQNIPLSVGANTITTVVTAQDGTTTKTYTLTVTRATGPLGVANPQSYAVRNTADDGIIVHQGISPNGDGQNDALIIEGITNYPDNKLTIMNRSGVLIFEAKGYDNSTKVFNGHSSKTGKMQQPGTYFYSLEYKSGGVTKHKTGFIILKY